MKIETLLPLGKLDEVLQTVATIGTHDTIVDQLKARYGDRVDRLGFCLVSADHDHGGVQSDAVVQR